MACSLIFSGVLFVVQVVVEIKDNAKLRRLKYMIGGPDEADLAAHKREDRLRSTEASTGDAPPC